MRVPALLPRLALAAVLACWAVPGHAGPGGTATGTLNVTVTVESACDFTVSDISFGSYKSGQASDLDASGAINYTNCAGATLSLELDDGQSPGDGERGLSSGGDSVLRYDIFSDAAHTDSIGTSAKAEQVVADQTGNGTITLYGRIFKGQVATAGSYSDEIAVTLTF